MAESLHPWLLDYFAENARFIGTEESKIRPYQKRKKLQLIKILSGDDDDPDVWAVVSDKDRKLTARFCLADPAIKRDILRHRSAIISISNFKGILARIPLPGQRKLSDERVLVLECQDARLLGSFGEPIFGKPIPLTHSAALEHTINKPGRVPSPKPNHQTTLPAMQMSSGQVQPLPPKRTRDILDPLTAYTKSWQDFSQTSGAAFRDMVVVSSEPADYSSLWEDFAQTTGAAFSQLSGIQNAREASKTEKISEGCLSSETAKTPSSAFRESLKLDGRGYPWIREAEIRDVIT